MSPLILLFFLYYISIPHFSFADHSNFINLSDLDYSISSEGFDSILIRTFSTSKDKDFKVMLYNGTHWSTSKECIADEFLNLKVLITQGNITASLSFNVSCQTQGIAKNIYVIKDVKESIKTDRISVSWNSPSNETKFYLIYFMKENNENITFTTDEREATFSMLKEKSWYQFCIATIHEKWRTSRFFCKTILTDFVETGPVTNVTAFSESDKIFISWSLPQYKHDIPQAYLVYIDGNTVKCRTFIIYMKNVSDIFYNDLCSKREIQYWSILQTLEIHPLSPYTVYRVKIIPFNRDKKSVNISLDIQTKEGKSDAVERLKIIHDQKSLLINFNEPQRPRGKIIKYQLKIKKTFICKKSNVEVYFTKFDKGKYFPTSLLKNCGSYIFEVSPVNGWKQNGGVGEMASAPFEYYTSKPMESAIFEVRFISTNMMSLSVRNLVSEDKCPMEGFVTELTDGNDRSNCLKIIGFAENCSELREMINERFKCSNSKFVKFDTDKTKVEIFSSFFDSSKKIQIEASTINNKIGTSLYPKVSHMEQIKDCFTDCYINKKYYMGIRTVTVDGELCMNWKESTYSNYETTKSNICSLSKHYKPWCPISRGWKECDVPLCSTIDYRTGCVKILEKEVSMESLTIKWSPPPYNNTIGYLTLLHNLDHSCEQYHIQLCNDCGSITSIENQVKGFYLSCSSKLNEDTISYKTIFSNLHQNRTYSVYIIPIIDKKRTGEVKEVIMYTKLAKPKIPKIKSIKSDSLNEIQIAWDKSEETRTNGIAAHYSLRIRKVNSIEVVKKDVSTESYKFTNLKPCCEYCIQLAAVNDGGTSNFTEEVCEYTLGPKPSLVKVEKPDSGYMSRQKIKWKYLGNDTCLKTFRLYGQIKFTVERFELTSDKESVTIEGLKRNVIYTVKVRAESRMKTLKDENIGEYSEIVEFYTGNTNQNVSYYNQTFDDTFRNVKLKWGIEEQMRGAIFEFTIVLMNSSKLCTKAMSVRCTNCTNLAKTTFLSQSDQDRHERLTKDCKHVQNEKFYADQIDFDYTIKNEEVGNFSVEIFSMSLLGVKSIYKTSANIFFPKQIQWTMIIIIIIIICILFGVILIVLLRKRNPYLFQRFLKNQNEDSSAFMLKMGNISENKKSNSVFRSSNGDKIKRSSSGTSLEIEPQPELMPKKKNHLIRIIDFSAYYDRVSRNGNSELIKDYKYMTNATKVLEASLGLTVEAGKAVTNARKNRFINILPFDQYRVKIGDKGTPFDYINASYIPFAGNEADFEYIASQGPIETTLADFWQMVLEQNIYLIIMLTKTMEGDKLKCLQYWPENIDESISYGNKNQFTVTLLKEVNEESFIERDLRLEYSTNKESREIKQLHMHTWMDHSAPDLDMFDKLLFRFHEIQASNNSFPYLIHCSAGVGRTGTLICIDRIIKDLINGNENINIYDNVLKLRRYRNFMVQRQTQYIFIHEYVNHFIKKYMQTKVEEVLYFNEE